MKVKISFEIDYDLETESKEVHDAFIGRLRDFYENNLPIPLRGFFKELSSINITDDYNQPDKKE